MQNNLPLSLGSIEMGAEPNSKNPRVWIVTVPFFSHFRCALQLAQLIARHGLTVTLFGAEDDIQRLQTCPSQIPESSKGLDIHFRTLEIQQPDFGGQGNARFMKPFEQTELAFESVLDEELGRGLRPTCVISDFFLTRSRELATSFGIPAWPFIPMAASFITTYIYIKHLASKGILTLPDSFLDLDSSVLQEPISLPGLPLGRLGEMNAIYFKDNPLYPLGWQCYESLLKADVLIMRGFRELESQSFDALEKLLRACAVENSRKMPQVWTAGPMFPFTSQNQISKTKKTDDEEVNPSISFLDSQPPSSVVYVAFGTDVSISQEQLLELVHGLESSQQPFLCVLHPRGKASNSQVHIQDIVSDVDPDCLARIGSRSLFVEWAPQMEVLSHPSTGAFISHCGFSSVLESACIGVPLIGWPYQYDQFINCRELVDGAQIALEVCPGLIHGGFVTRKDIEKSINKLFHSEEGTVLRERVLQMKHRAEESVGENGSSAKNIKALVSRIQSLAKQIEC